MGSGSAGNSIYLAAGQTSLLIDAGLSAAQINKRLALIGVDVAGLDGIIISHEHGDHIKGIGVLGRRFKIPIFINCGAYNKLNGTLKGEEPVVHFSTGDDFSLGQLDIHPFCVPHDAAEPVGFIICYGSYQLGVAMDLGCVTHVVREKLKDSHMLILESNYEPRLLQSGPYPWSVKQRVQGRYGHLSNQGAAELLSELLHPGLKHVAMVHVSKTNNHPRLVYDQAKAVLDKSNIKGIQLTIARQDQVSTMIKL